MARTKNTSKAKVFSLNISPVKGTAKIPVNSARFIAGFGLENDAHGAPGERQVSILAIEAIKKQQACPKVKNSGVILGPGVFGENLTTQGIDLTKLVLGDKLKLGSDVVLEISKIGKDCHKYCAIYYKTGDCIMPKQGIFARVISEGQAFLDDPIVFLK